eukprot:TRINITY_DN616_c0_g1_i1.p1 TRINITY_DN616_c0_g1~~TRINITY_DN616_c0_g1_i1.p1  ORF type:complete len:550 (-),score=79.69 TRINITY_DN616_c0_g1_i1:68-1717(-)
MYHRRSSRPLARLLIVAFISFVAGCSFDRFASPDYAHPAAFWRGVAFELVAAATRNDPSAAMSLSSPALAPPASLLHRSANSEGVFGSALRAFVEGSAPSAADRAAALTLSSDLARACPARRRTLPRQEGDVAALNGRDAAKDTADDIYAGGEEAKAVDGANDIDSRPSFGAPDRIDTGRRNFAAEAGEAASGSDSDARSEGVSLPACSLSPMKAASMPISPVVIPQHHPADADCFPSVRRRGVAGASGWPWPEQQERCPPVGDVVAALREAGLASTAADVTSPDVPVLCTPAYASSWDHHDVTRTTAAYAAFLDLLRSLRANIVGRWADILRKNPDYPSLDISLCPILTPECAVWAHPEVNVTGNTTDLPYRKCCIEHRRLLETTRYVVGKLVGAGIEHWIAQGTLLGAVRNRGRYIMWDTDVDIYVRGEDEQRVVDLFSGPFSETQHDFEKDHVKNRMQYMIFAGRKRSVWTSHVEIWLWRNNTRNPHLEQYDSYIFPLQQCPFGFYDLPVQCPADPEWLLRKWFGEKWREHQVTWGTTTKNFAGLF